MEQEELQESTRTNRVITIRDEALAPYEIDVLRRDYDVVRVTVKKDKTGKVIIDEETGKPAVNRVFVGQWPSIGQAVGAIIRKRTRDHSPELEGKVVTLRQYMDEYATYVKKMTAFWEYFTQHDSIDESIFKVKRDHVNKVFQIERK